MDGRPGQDNRDRDDAMQLNMQGKTNKCPPTERRNLRHTFVPAGILTNTKNLQPPRRGRGAPSERWRGRKKREEKVTEQGNKLVAESQIPYLPTYSARHVVHGSQATRKGWHRDVRAGEHDAKRPVPAIPTAGTFPINILLWHRPQSS